MEIERIDSGARMSRIVIHNRTVYLCGQVAQDPTSDVTGQTAQALAKVDGLLAQAGTDKSKLLSVTVYLADIGDFDAMNQAWDAWVPSGAAPARATVEAKLASPDLRVEVSVIAAQ